MNDANMNVSPRGTDFSNSTKVSSEENSFFSGASVKRKRSASSARRLGSPVESAYEPESPREENRASPQRLCTLEEPGRGGQDATLPCEHKPGVESLEVLPRAANRHEKHSKVLCVKNVALAPPMPNDLSPAQSAALRQLFELPVSGLHLLHIASVLGKGFDELSRLSKESGVDVTTNNGLTPLMVAPLNPIGACDTIRHLLALKADPQKTHAKGQNALHIAAGMHDNPAALVPLIEAGLNPFDRSNVNSLVRTSPVVQSPLHQASTHGRINNVLYMLSLASPGEGHATTALLASHANGKHRLYNVLSQRFPYLMDIPSLPLDDV